MNKSQLIAFIKTSSPSQSQQRYDHIFVYIQAHKHYPKLRYIWDKIIWAKTIDSDFAQTIELMTKIWYTTLSDYRTVARYLVQYHNCKEPCIIHTSDHLDTTKVTTTPSITLYNNTIGLDIMHWDQRYNRNLDSDLMKLLR